MKEKNCQKPQKKIEKFAQKMVTTVKKQKTKNKKNDEKN